MLTTTKGFLCKTCTHRGVAQNGSPACVLHKKIINPDIDFCSDHINQQETIPCDFCGQPVSPDDIRIHIFDSATKFLCQHCSQMVGTCQTCAYGNDCGFANDRSMPQRVNQTVRQGGMIMQTQIKNPKLVEKHCLSCRCSFGTQGNCLREEPNAACSNWMLGL